MSVGSSPPQVPPQVSPDGRWVWDGRQWQPVPVVVGDVAGVAPVVVATAPVPVPAVAQYTPPSIQVAPVIPYAVPVAEGGVVPLWVQDRPRIGGASMYLFVAAALVALI